MPIPSGDLKEEQRQQMKETGSQATTPRFSWKIVLLMKM